jgi:uncharacterized protein YdeI (YjbR/CyaY-like superfamily)
MDIKILYFKNSQEWRGWLEENHYSQKEVWLLHSKKNSNNAFISLSDAVEEAICFGWIDSKLVSIDKERYILKYTPRKSNSVWSKINKERAERLIESGKMTKAGIAKIEAAKKHGLWNAAYSDKKKERVPSDLKEALSEDKNAWNNFQEFVISYRNMYIRWVIGAKTAETRKKRIIEVTRRSAQNKKSGTE